MFSSAASPGGPETTSDSHFFTLTERPASQCRRRKSADRASAVKRNAFNPPPVAPLLQIRGKFIAC
jgi:hypothetical protein